MKTPKKLSFLTIPRIISLGLFAIAGLLFILGQSWFGYVLAGIILFSAPTKHAKTRFDKLLDAFKRWKTIIITALYDAAYWMFIFAGTWILQNALTKKSQAMEAAGIVSREALANPRTAATAAAAMGDVYHYIIASIVGIIIYATIVYGISRTLIWTTIANEKLTKKFTWRFMLTNSIWWLIFLAPIVVTMLAVQQAGNKQLVAQGGLFLTIILFTYFSPIMQTLFMRTRKIGYSIGNGLGFGISKLGYLIVPYTYAILVYLIAMRPLQLFQTTLYINYLNLVFIVLYFAWLRIYLYSIIKDFK